MSSRHAWSRVPFSVVGAITAGVALRTVFILFYPEMAGDSMVYGTIARNLVLHHAYALGDPFRLTLIRLPGYPFFLAAVFKIFGVDHYAPARPIQLAIDMGSCLLIAGFVREEVSARAGKAALWLAALCPFTASYMAIPLTETVSIFCVALAIFGAGRLIRRARGGGSLQHADTLVPVLLVSGALAGAILFRPDGVTLAAAVLPGVWWYTRPAGGKKAIQLAAVCALLAAVPFVPWTIRNYARFKVFQPLAPRYANDPTEFVPVGYIRWTKTWLAEYVSSPEIYWEGGDQAMDPGLLPERAFDSAAQRGETYRLIADYNLTCSADGESNCAINPALDARFQALAEDRFRAHPLRSCVGLPLMRLADMWLRPRTEFLPMPMRWWEWRLHPGASVFSGAYALLDVFLAACAAAAFARRRVPLAGMLLAYLGLRSVLLMTIENAEPRYTLECFPVILAAAALTLARESRRGLAGVRQGLLFGSGLAD